MSASRPFSSALPPEADVKHAPGERLLVTQSQKRQQHFSSNSLVQLVNRIFKAAGVDTSSHAMRRQFITNLANNAVNPRIIQKLANHRSLPSAYPLPMSSTRYPDF